MASAMTSFEFEEFTYRNGDGGYENCSRENFIKLEAYIKKSYPEIESIEEQVPELIIWCNESVPSSSQRPLFIAGLSSVWLIKGKNEHLRDFAAPERGNMCIILNVEKDVAEDIFEHHIPRTETLHQLIRRHFPGALALNFIANRIIVKLPYVPLESHRQRVNDLPGQFYHTTLSIVYFNGLTTSGGQPLVKKTEPTSVDGKCDATGWVAASGSSQPGAVLGNETGNTGKDGELVEKGDELDNDV